MDPWNVCRSHVRNEVAVHDIDLDHLRSACACDLMRVRGTCSQSAPWSMVAEQAAPKAAKSAERMDGAMIVGGDMMALSQCLRDREVGTRRS